jgi:acetyltransferase-like isoleucine patch superfamily enzyme
VKIRRGQGPFWGTVKGLVKKVLHFHIPVFWLTRPLFRALYLVHVLGREGLGMALRFFWYEPLFRSQCARVGQRFRLEKLPYLTGKGRIVIGDAVRLSGKSSFGFSNRAHAEPLLEIGDGTFIGHGCSFSIGDSVRIGRHCLLAAGVGVLDLDGHPLDAEQRRAHQPTPADAIKPVVIGDDVWVGTDALIMKGVTIGDRSVVAARSVVTKDVPPDVVVAGTPARIVKRLREGEWTQAECA